MNVSASGSPEWPLRDKIVPQTPRQRMSSLAIQHRNTVAPQGSVEVLSRADLQRCPQWANAFASQRKDHRYYEIVEDTIREGFEYRYFGIKDANGTVCAIQPFFILDQDILVGPSPRIGNAITIIRRALPRFMRMRTLMVGCTAGEAHLDSVDELPVRLLASTIIGHARELGASLIVLKEFPAKYRSRLQCFLQNGFVRVPSLPMTKLNIDYASFDEYMQKALSSSARACLRKKFRHAARAPPIELTVRVDVTPIVDDVYPLYLQVYERAKLRFEKLTSDYFCRLGQAMPDTVRFFIWRQNSRAVAFSLCMLEGDSVYAEYIGLDYSVALDLHLYYHAVRDVITWAISHGYKWFRSSALGYDPKLHLKHALDPVDLYVRHTSGLLNAPLKIVLPLIEPTRYDKTLRRFPNYNELWGDA